jgi:hypothetical protein
MNDNVNTNHRFQIQPHFHHSYRINRINRASPASLITPHLFEYLNYCNTSFEYRIQIRCLNTVLQYWIWIPLFRRNLIDFVAYSFEANLRHFWRLSNRVYHCITPINFKRIRSKYRTVKPISKASNCRDWSHNWLCDRFIIDAASSYEHSLVSRLT